MTISAGVTSIGLRAFQDCTNLASVTIASSVVSISDDAFLNCPNLASITIPERFRGQEARLKIPAGAAITYIP